MSGPSDKITWVASDKMELDYPKGRYPEIPVLAEETDRMGLYGGLALLAVRRKVYEYIAHRDKADSMVTVYNNPAEYTNHGECKFLYSSLKRMIETCYLILSIV